MAGIAIAAIQGAFLLLWAGMHGRRWAKSKQKKKQTKKNEKNKLWAETDMLAEGDDYASLPTSSWSVAHVAAWATHSVRLGTQTRFPTCLTHSDQEEVNILVGQKITGDVLLSVTEGNLTEMGMKVGPKKKLVAALADLKEK